jgi:ribosomal protein S18 acetylase RimI-like enzyme
VKIRSYEKSDQAAVIELWRKCGLTRPQNDPKKDIARKLKVNPELFLVGVEGTKVVATAMGGYEGHRGWVNYLGVDPDYRKKGLAKQLMETLEEKLLERGCPKLNLQVFTTNIEAMEFYDRIGYQRDEVVSYGKRLIPD